MSAGQLASALLTHLKREHVIGKPQNSPFQGNVPKSVLSQPELGIRDILVGSGSPTLVPDSVLDPLGSALIAFAVSGSSLEIQIGTS